MSDDYRGRPPGAPRPDAEERFSDILPAPLAPEEDDLPPELPVFAIRRRGRARRVVTICVLVLILGGVAAWVLYGMFRGPDPVYAETTMVMAGDINQMLNTNGTITSGERVTVYSPVAAPISEVLAELGRTVEAGQQLFRFDTRTLELNYRQAAANSGLSNLQQQQSINASNESQQAADDYQASIDNVQVQLANAQATLEQAIATYAGNLPVITQLTGELADYNQQLEWEYYYNSGQVGDMDKVVWLKETIAGLEAQLAAFQAPLNAARQDVAYQTELLAKVTAARQTAENGVLDDNARQQLDYQQVPTQVALENAQRNLELAAAGVTAPIGGVVTSLTLEPGAYVNQYAALCVIESTEKVGVTINLSRYDLERVYEGQPATVTSLGVTYDATVTKINQMATQVSGTGVVSATVTLLAPDGKVRLGLEASVAILTGRAADVLMVPVEAVNTDVMGTYCFVIEDGIAHRRDITLGLSSDTAVEVVSGLSLGEEVAVYSQNLADGDQVTDDPSYAPTAGLLDLLPI